MHHPYNQQPRHPSSRDQRPIRPLALAAIIALLGVGQMTGSTAPSAVPPPTSPPVRPPLTPAPTMPQPMPAVPATPSPPTSAPVVPLPWDPASPPPVSPVVPTPAPIVPRPFDPPPAANVTVPGTINADADFATAQWAEISDFGYERREDFFSGLRRLENKVAGQTAELMAKRATMSGIAHTQDWDFAMKEMDSARSYLTAMGRELSQSTPESWTQRKDRVGQAWNRTQEAYAKVKSSTTI